MNRKKIVNLIYYRTLAELRLEARRYYISYLWWILEPILDMMVFYVVFGILLKRSTHDFIPFLLIGISTWKWFNKTVVRCANSIIASGRLIQQVKVPKAIFPIIVVCTDTIKFGIVLLILIFFINVYGLYAGSAYLFLPLMLMTQLLFIFAVGGLFAAVTPFFPDILLILSRILHLGFFLSGIFYKGSNLPPEIQFWFYLNPMATLIDGYRGILMYNMIPDFMPIFNIILFSFCLLSIAVYTILHYGQNLSEDYHLMNNTNKEPVIQLDNVGYYYVRRNGFFSWTKFWALKQISFQISKGDSLGIIGRNGAGKSTLLRLLAGIIKPDAGKYTNYGYSASLMSLQAGFVSYLTGRENTLLSGMMLGMDKDFILDRIDRISEFSELGFFFDQPVNSYSTGMRARLGFSIAFLLDTDVLLIDEVLGVGDISFRQKSFDQIHLKIVLNHAVVLVSHSPNMVNQLCNKAIWIEEGQIMHRGKASEVTEEYTRFHKK